MKKKMLFDLPGTVFDIFLEKYQIRNSIKDIYISWLGVKLPARYVVLPLASQLESPTLIYFDQRETEFRCVRLLLLKNPPDLFKYTCVPDTDMDIYFSIDVGENELPDTSVEGISGYKVNLYMELHFGNQGIVNMIDENLIFSNLYSSQITSRAYDLWLDKGCFWASEFFRTIDGQILPLKK